MGRTPPLHEMALADEPEIDGIAQQFPLFRVNHGDDDEGQRGEAAPWWWSVVLA